jgi:hypothetical protein
VAKGKAAARLRGVRSGAEARFGAEKAASSRRTPKKNRGRAGLKIVLQQEKDAALRGDAALNSWAKARFGALPFPAGLNGLLPRTKSPGLPQIPGEGARRDGRKVRPYIQFREKEARGGQKSGVKPPHSRESGRSPTPTRTAEAGAGHLEGAQALRNSG